MGRPGSKPSRERRYFVYERDGYQCFYCRAPVTLETATLDHVKLRSQGGSNAQHNLVTCCYACNQARGDQPFAEFANRDARRRYALLVAKVDDPCRRTDWDRPSKRRHPRRSKWGRFRAA